MALNPANLLFGLHQCKLIFEKNQTPAILILLSVLRHIHLFVITNEFESVFIRVHPWLKTTFYVGKTSNRNRATDAV
jgi:hypothetical protein